MEGFLRPTAVVDWKHPAVLAQAVQLRGCLDDAGAIARRCFEWVRDTIRHTSDYQLDVVTCTASETLTHGSGFCYAKSHLLAAFLRANGIPAGFCYQRVRVDDTSPRYSLHGLNAVWLPGIGWYRIDARGNRADVDAQFTPPIEQLAFATTGSGEASLPEVWPDPLPVVVDALRAHCSAQSLYQHLPDVLLVGPAQ